jgi:hypothetical protein
MGVTRVRFLLEMWRRSSGSPSISPPTDDKPKSAEPWSLPAPTPPPKVDPSRHPPRWPG